MYNIMRMEMFDTVNRYSDVTETVLLSVITLCQLKVTKLYLEQFINTFIKPNGFHLETD